METFVTANQDFSTVHAKMEGAPCRDRDPDNRGLLRFALVLILNNVLLTPTPLLYNEICTR
jgi:hypothetical protein